MSAKRIIIVLNDNDPVFARVSKLKFEKEAGWETIITTSYTEALAQAKKVVPNILLTEILIEDSQGRNGFDLIEAICKLEEHTKITVAVLSELGQIEDQQKALQLGANYYFVKSQISIINLIEKLKNIVDKK